MLDDIFTKHKNVALQFSGGKDSLALLYSFKEYWDLITVYWCNTGSAYPETISQMKEIKKIVPKFVEVRSNKELQNKQFGWPSDVVPTIYTRRCQESLGKKAILIQDRLDCCFSNLMLPLHEKMIRDGVDCILRGRRKEEGDITPINSGYVDSSTGITIYFPIYDWSKQMVIDFMEKNTIQLPESYKYANTSLDCIDCSAWWGEGKANYLKLYHKEAYENYVYKRIIIKNAIIEQLAKD